MNEASPTDAVAATSPLPVAPSPFALTLVSPEDPCGPDLDLEGDSDFLNFVAATEGLLPAKPDNYYAFKRDAVDFPATFAAGDKLLKRTLDARLLVLLARLSLLNRDIKGFARWVGGLAWLMREHWEGAHPRAEGQDYSARIGQLLTFEDNSSVLLPLQYAPLLETRREGAFSYRDHQLATGLAQPRVETRYNPASGQKETSEPEKFMPQKAIERLLREVEIAQVAEIVDVFQGLSASLDAIQATTVEHLGFERGVEFKRLRPLVKEMTEYLRGVLFARDPTLAPPPEPATVADEAEGAAAAPVGARAAFASRAEIDAALDSAFGYFAVNEPSSPALLLIRQARETLGRNLYEVMSLLTPSHADSARVFVGPDGAFTVPVSTLSAAPTAQGERASTEPAASRAAALALVDAVAAHMQRAEPSSPVPYLLERARALASRDFMSLLTDLLPEDDIEALKKGR